MKILPEARAIKKYSNSSLGEIKNSLITLHTNSLDLPLEEIGEVNKIRLSRYFREDETRGVVKPSSKSYTVILELNDKKNNMVAEDVAKSKETQENILAYLRKLKSQGGKAEHIIVGDLSPENMIQINIEVNHGGTYNPDEKPAFNLKELFNELEKAFNKFDKTFNLSERDEEYLNSQFTKNMLSTSFVNVKPRQI